MSQPVMSESLLEQFSDILADKTGLCFPRERWKDLEKKLVPLMLSLGFGDLSTCVKALIKHLSHNELIADLAYHLTIGETYFFRDSQAFAVIENILLPDLIAKHRNDRHLRIWSAGCCTGEEPYSLAIAIQRRLPDYRDWNIHLLGSDINPAFLQKARRGIYSRWSLRATPREVINQYFCKQSNGSYQLIPAIRDMVSFVNINLVDGNTHSSDSQEAATDLILCNNVLIYFGCKQIESTINRLTQALGREGWLSSTPIEAPFINHAYLSPHSFEGTIFFQKDTISHPIAEHKFKNSHVVPAPAATSVPNDHEDLLLRVVLPAFLKSATPVLEYRFTSKPELLLPKPAVEPPQTPTSDEIYNTCSLLVRQKHYDKAINILLKALSPGQSNLEVLRQRANEVILLIRTYANQGDLKQALTWCEAALKANKLDPILHYLHAEVLSDLNQHDSAIKSLKRAIFLDPDFVAAHYLLGLLERQNHKIPSARKAFREALELAGGYAPHDILPGTEELTAEHIKEYLSAILRSHKDE